MSNSVYFDETSHLALRYMQSLLLSPVAAKELTNLNIMFSVRFLELAYVRDVQWS